MRGLVEPQVSIRIIENGQPHTFSRVLKTQFLTVVCPKGEYVRNNFIFENLVILLQLCNPHGFSKQHKCAKAACVQLKQWRRYFPFVFEVRYI